MADFSSWTSDIDTLLNNIRINCLFLGKAHKKRYFENKDRLKWYRLPVIVLNGANSIISVGLQPYTTQGVISITTSLIALTCGIVGSIELYLGLQKRLENDMISQRDYYLLSVESSEALLKKIDDKLIPISLNGEDEITVVSPRLSGRVNLDLPNGRQELSTEDE